MEKDHKIVMFTSRQKNCVRRMQHLMVSYREEVAGSVGDDASGDGSPTALGSAPEAEGRHASDVWLRREEPR